MNSSSSFASGDTADRERTLGFAGSPNFRDAGGYAVDGGTLHWGRLFRSGHLAALSSEEQERLRALELALVVDLRRADERDWEPSRLPPGTAVHGADITPGSHTSAIYADSTQLGGAEAMHRFMCDINREFVRSQTGVYREVFAALLDSGADRVLFHCAAGKDRTGFAIAMLQAALGVSTDDIEADYLLSGQYFLVEEQIDRIRAKYAVNHLGDADLAPMMHTDLAYLRSALDEISVGWGDTDVYLEEGLGLGLAERRELRRRFVDA